MKIGIILGTRPEIIKLSSVIRHCKEQGMDYFIVHTNQHYSENMDSIFFQELELPQAKYNLGIGSGTHGEMTGRMMIEIEKVFIQEKPDVILVQGDTNTVMAGALVASKMGIKVGHIEAGLRSFDRTMPEEINRIVTDHISDYLFCPTNIQSDILLSEGIYKESIFVTGNTVVDAVTECLEISKKKSTILQTHDLKENEYILMTSHRPSTVDVQAHLQAVIDGVEAIAMKCTKKIVFPIHPRTKKMIESFGIVLSELFILIEPVGYLDMLSLQKNSFLIVTDSGGLQEESCILEKKCVVIRENTERPEAVEVGGCVLAGNSDAGKIISLSMNLIEKNVQWKNPFGDGRSGKEILRILSQ
jgi:UDP-N-acetylglucosamine 2-epimerase (non-hydrolysing)